MAYKKFSTTKATALAAAVSASATTIEVVDGSSYPDPAIGGNGPYTLLLAYGSDREEIVTVTAKPSANTLTVTRGQDGSAATVKNIGDIVVHGVSKRDWEDIQTQADSLSTQMAAKAPLASPALTGNPTAPTPAAGDNDTSIATTAFVQQQVPIGTIVMWGGTTAPAGWHLCDGTAHGSAALKAVIGSDNTPDLRNLFILGASATRPNGTKGGAETVTLTVAQMPGHSHGGGTATQSANHTHGGRTNDTDPVHSHTSSYRTGTGGPPEAGGWDGDVLKRHTGAPPGGYWITNGFANSGSANHGHDFTTGTESATHAHGITAEGGGAAHENMPPFYALTYIVKKA